MMQTLIYWIASLDEALLAAIQRWSRRTVLWDIAAVVLVMVFAVIALVEGINGQSFFNADTLYPVQIQRLCLA